MMIEKRRSGPTGISNRVSILIIAVAAMTVTIGASAKTYEYKANTAKRIEVPLSNQGVNRIMIEKDRIMKVVGNDSDYSIEGEMLRGYIFITPRVLSGQQIPITIITEKGLIQDITFKVSSKISPTSVNILQDKKAVNKSFANDTSDSANQKEQALKMVSNIATGKTSQYTLKKQNTTSYSVLPMKVSKVLEYKGRYYKALVLEFTEIREVELSSLEQYFPGALVIAKRGNVIIVVRKIW